MIFCWNDVSSGLCASPRCGVEYCPVARRECGDCGCLVGFDSVLVDVVPDVVAADVNEFVTDSFVGACSWSRAFVVWCLFVRLRCHSRLHDLPSVVVSRR